MECSRLKIKKCKRDKEFNTEHSIIINLYSYVKYFVKFLLSLLVETQQNENISRFDLSMI